MLINNKLLPAFLFCVSFVMAACAGTPNQRSSGEYIDDTSITTQIKAALIDSPFVDALDVDIEVFRGKVQLNGFVNSEQARQQAERIATDVKGVLEVINNLKVTEVSSTVGQYVDDATITAKVKSALIGDSLTSVYKINVETREGVVQLSGWVDNKTAKDKAGDIASSVKGVKSVLNDIGIRQ